MSLSPAKVHLDFQRNFLVEAEIPIFGCVAQGGAASLLLDGEAAAASRGAVADFRLRGIRSIVEVRGREFVGPPGDFHGSTRQVKAHSNQLGIIAVDGLRVVLVRSSGLKRATC